MSKTSRAGCQNRKCQDKGIKIQQGELRFGTLVMYPKRAGWRWKHWGCVSPVQIKHLQEQVGPFQGRDLGTVLDGYDELTQDAKAKVIFALQNGHIADEDWKGRLIFEQADPNADRIQLPCLNRPGMKGINRVVSAISRQQKGKQRRGQRYGRDEEDDEYVDEGAADAPLKRLSKKSRHKMMEDREGRKNDLFLSPTPAPRRAPVENINVSTKMKKGQAVDLGNCEQGRPSRGHSDLNEQEAHQRPGFHARKLERQSAARLSMIRNNDFATVAEFCFRDQNIQA